MVNSKEFLQAANIVKILSKTPTNDELGLLYGYYKQAMCGDNTSSKPFMFDLHL
jgi:acyl-CoA-binding protein